MSIAPSRHHPGMTRTPNLRWAVEQGGWAFQANTPCKFQEPTRSMSMRGLSGADSVSPAGVRGGERSVLCRPAGTIGGGPGGACDLSQAGSAGRGRGSLPRGRKRRSGTGRDGLPGPSFAGCEQRSERGGDRSGQAKGAGRQPGCGLTGTRRQLCPGRRAGEGTPLRPAL
jgi:hypothetical protein